MVYLDPDYEEVQDFLEDFTEDEQKRGAEFYGEIRRLYESHPDEGNLQEVVEGAVPEEMVSILGRNMVDYIRALLTDYCAGWMRNHQEGEDVFFAPEDMVRVFYTLMKVIRGLETSMDSLGYALTELRKGKEGQDGKADKELH